MVVRLVRPEYPKPQLTNLNASCKVCKVMFRRPGIDNKFCCEEHKKSYIQYSHRKLLKRQRKNKRIPKQNKIKSRNHVSILLTLKRDNGPDRRLSLFAALSEKTFYSTREWLQLRYKVLLKHGRKCLLCNATGVEIHVDHIKPISKYPELALDPMNLQVLCRDCNLGKSNKDQTDFRIETPKG